MNLKLNCSFISLILLCIGYLSVISVVGQTKQHTCRVSNYDFQTDRVNEFANFRSDFEDPETIRTFRIPNSKLFVTVGVSSDKDINKLFLSLVIGKKAFKGNVDEFKSGNFFHNSSVSLPLKSFEFGGVSTVLIEKKLTYSISFECLSKK